MKKTLLFSFSIATMEHQCEPMYAQSPSIAVVMFTATQFSSKPITLYNIQTEHCSFTVRPGLVVLNICTVFFLGLVSHPAAPPFHPLTSV